MIEPALQVAVLMLGLGSANLLTAQATERPDSQAPPASATQAPRGAVKIPGRSLYDLLERKSIVFPDIAASTEPLSVGQKFELFADNSIAVHSVVWSSITSGISQATNSPTGFGQGWDAYGKRFGSSMARRASSEFFGTFLLASALHEDPRFFSQTEKGFGQSVKYSVRRIFVTQNDSGDRVANISGLLGPAMGEALANVYWPERNRTVGDTLMRYGIDIASRAGGNMVRQYWPVVYRKLRR